MRVFIAGIDGYLGWSLAKALAGRGHVVAGADALLRRRWVEEMGSCSAIPIAPIAGRLDAFRERFGRPAQFYPIDIREYPAVEEALREFRPEAVVHLGECPSAPYSMIDVGHATFVQVNNITTTFNLLFAIRDHCPDAHLVKLGTMGEYGTPDVDIPEGFFEVEYRARRDRLPFPRQAGSWYHWSKVHGSNNVMFACRLWGLRATDVMQGVVFGTRIDPDPDADDAPEDERLRTRLDFDQAFGTAVNRFCCQAVIGHPLTVYGGGGQRRGLIPLQDAMQCLVLALEHPPAAGDYRVFNQFEGVHDLLGLAGKVREAAEGQGLRVELRHLENPRREAEGHYYHPDRRHLLDLGYRPTHDFGPTLAAMLRDLLGFRDRIEAKRDVLLPDVHWDGSRRKVRPLDSQDVPLDGR